MATGYAIFEEEGEYSDHRKELRAIALNSNAATAKAKRLAEEFVEEQKTHTPHSTPIEILRRNTSFIVRIGKMGCGPRDVSFYAEEAPLAGSQ